jgi:predicted RNA-binding protein with EMAP domain
VKYAVTKISKYKEFTTFEVMKSTKNKPKQMPKNLEGVFVLRKKKDGSKGEVKSSSETKSEVRSHSKMEKIESRA